MYVSIPVVNLTQNRQLAVSYDTQWNYDFSKAVHIIFCGDHAKSPGFLYLLQQIIYKNALTNIYQESV